MPRQKPSHPGKFAKRKATAEKRLTELIERFGELIELDGDPELVVQLDNTYRLTATISGYCLVDDTSHKFKLQYYAYIRSNSLLISFHCSNITARKTFTLNLRGLWSGGKRISWKKNPVKAEYSLSKL